jgi:DNA-directed RNA polymerase subunit RPC12/RpoP
MQLFHSHPQNEKLRCPYKGCEKTFEKPTVLTDTSTIPRQSYYACPHCMSKLDLVTENMKIVGVKATEYPKVFESPAKCAHFSALLNTRPMNAPLSDECLLCPKVLQCNIRKV